MGGMRHCLLLVLLHLALGLAFRETASINGNAHSTFLKNQNTGNYHYVRHKVSKRSTGPGGDACKALQGYGDGLINNTHMVSTLASTTPAALPVSHSTLGRLLFAYVIAAEFSVGFSVAYRLLQNFVVVCWNANSLLDF